MSGGGHPLALYFSAAAIDDALATSLWLDGLRPGLGREFVAELTRLGEHICRHLDMYERFRGHCRRAVLKRFDYALVYRVSTEGVLIVAVLPCRLDPAAAVARAGNVQ